MSYINCSLYHYAGNNPVKYLDPDGLETYDSSITWEQFVNISQGCRIISKGYEVTVDSKTWNEAQQFFAENLIGVYGGKAFGHGLAQEDLYRLKLT